MIEAATGRDLRTFGSDRSPRTAANVVKIARGYCGGLRYLWGVLLSQRGYFKMRTPDQYREFAAECYRMAAEAKTEERQKILQEMAQAWREVAEEVETKS